MKISTKGRYGLTTMLELALHHGEGPISRSHIAERHDLSPKYMHALLTSLITRGLVRSHRGNTGGYVLAKLPEEISLLEIIESLEGPIALVDCVTNDASCNKSVRCSTSHFWNGANSVLRDYFSDRTLLDVVNNHNERN